MGSMYIKTLSIIVALLVVSAAGCSSRETHIANLQSENPIERMDSCAWLGKYRVEDATADLVKRLDDEDPAVRMAANQALIEITGEDFGYKTWKSRDESREAAQKYLQWWQEKSTQQKEAPAETPEK